ncbi:MAG TPA: Do family serine endopeptidase [Blastocatellia bacterium]|nr:Do family serine endopeptidase [Blastocatellia bacterium]
MDLKTCTKGVCRARILALCAALALAVAGGYLGHHVAQAEEPQPVQLPSPADLSRTFIGVAKQIKPAVVNLEVVEKASTSRRSRMEGFPQLPPGFSIPETPRRRQGTGSGVIISPDGYILTNNHVAGDADEIKVKLSDGRELKATRVGTDQETDIAVIKVEATNLPFARLGDSGKLEQGEWVIALGSPFGLEQTMTAGIVSATGRDLRRSTYDNYIQTDASINPGNSGGPLVNMEGEVVGINTMIISPTGVSTGIGFAVPSNLVSKVYAQLIKSGKVTRGYLGVTLKPVTPALADAVGFSGRQGAVVDDLASDTAPAAKAGLKDGDVIVEFDGKPIATPKELTEVVADTPVGKTAQLKYVRNGRTQTTQISLAERPSQTSTQTPEPEGEDDPSAARLGVRTSTVTPEIVRELKLKISSGVVVESVQPGSAASEAGLQRADVIHRVNRTPVTSQTEFMRVLAAVKGQSEIVLQIERGGRLAFLSVTMD